MLAAYLIDGTGKRKSFPLSQSVTTVGSEERSELLLGDSTVSRQHARIEKLRDGQFLIVDAGSRNGTFVNGIAVQQRRLRDGDEVTFGNRQFEFLWLEYDSEKEKNADSSIESFITDAGQNLLARETREIGGEQAPQFNMARAGHAWQFFRAFTAPSHPAADPIVEILEDLAGMQGIGCVCWIVCDSVKSSGASSYRHCGEPLRTSAELAAAKLRESAEKEICFYSFSGVFSQGDPLPEETPDSIVFPFPGGAVLAESQDLEGLPKDLVSAVQGAAGAIGLGHKLRCDAEKSIQAAVRSRPSVDHGIVGNSAAICRAIEQCRKAASYDTPVLVTGPTGTGKELFAHLIHEESRRGENHDIFVVACNELYDQLGGELFGKEAGAYTDAKAASPAIYTQISLDK